MPLAIPYPAEDNTYLAEHVLLLRNSLLALTGRDLFGKDCAPAEAAKAIFHAPFALLSHNTAPDPLLTYGNQTVLKLFELTWEELTVMPSRCTAEALAREERARLLARVAEDGFIDDYSGVRISKNGRLFRIKQALVWNLRDEKGVFCGQAAMFANWNVIA
ncbi:MEKHLA domain-containing protein [Desulfobulbus sp. F4]|nr:MEKHLA domain-containing protein [Desulfobulbus sp. F3]MCW5200815.1 MEKHLA domain-containing protein [Desulfobulbus sp. F4]